MGDDRPIIRFGSFEVNLQTGELRSSGTKIKVQELPFRVLTILLDRPGELVTREELKSRIWPKENFGDFDHAVNVAVTKLRTALGDSPDDPRYVETLPRRGYRFIAPIEALAAGGAGLQGLKPDTDSGHNVEGNSERGATERADSSAARKRKRVVAGVAIALALLASLGYAIHVLWLGRSRPIAFQNFTVTQATDSGKVALAAISPDGKYLVTVNNDKGRESFWLRNLPTNSETKVLLLSEAHVDSMYDTLSFAPNGNYIYFRKTPVNSTYVFDLYRAPVLGGASQQPIRDIDTGVTFSPDGARMAYGVWNDPEEGKWRLISAKPDGTDEKVLQMAPYYPRLNSVAWSPDHRWIACAIEQPDGAEGGIDLFDVFSGQTRGFTRFADKLPWHIAWAPDQSGLFVLYEGKFTHSGRPQIGFVSYPAGEFRTITNDTNSYGEFTLTADGRILATVQERIDSEIDLLPGSGAGIPRMPPGIAKQMVINDASWAGNSHLLLSEDTRLVKIPVDGSNPVNLFDDPSARIQSAAVCGQDQFIVFSSPFHGITNSQNIWRINADGANPEKLTQGRYDFSPVCSPDGKWVYFADSSNFQLMRVPVAGGKSEQVPGSAVTDPEHIFFPIALAPHGNLIAFIFSTTSPATRRTSHKLAVVDLDGDPGRAMQVRAVDPRAIPIVQFTPDGKSVAYVIGEQGVGNLWIQPLDGSKGRQITNFTSQEIKAFQWSPDGKSLVLIRTDTTRDAILLQQTDR